VRLLLPSRIYKHCWKHQLTPMNAHRDLEYALLHSQRKRFVVSLQFRGQRTTLHFILQLQCL
jgi:hypothetical protein